MTENTEYAYGRWLAWWNETGQNLSDSNRAQRYFAIRSMLLEGIIKEPSREKSPPRNAFSPSEYSASLQWLSVRDYDLYLFVRTVGDLGVEPFQIIEKAKERNALTQEMIRWNLNAWYVDLKNRGGGTVRYEVPSDLAEMLKAYARPDNNIGPAPKERRCSMWAVGYAAMHKRMKKALADMAKQRIVRSHLQSTFDLWRKAPIERLGDDARWRDFRGGVA